MVPIPHFCSSAPKCNLLASSTERVDSAEGEKCLIVAVYLDSKAELLSQTKRLALAAGSEPLVDRVTASKLLHVCCNLDSAECASALLGGELGAIPLVNELDDSGKSPLHTAAAAHAARCVEVLLEEDARTDLRSKDGQAQLALELSLCDKRIDVNWNLNDFSIEDLVIHMSEKDLSTVRLLCDKTKEIAEVAYAYAVQGRVAAFTALLIVAAEKVNVSVLELRDSESDSKEKVTIYECLVREALAVGGSTTPLRAAKRTSTATESGNLEKKKVLLREIELLQLFGAVGHSGGADKKVTTPLIRAAREGDEAVIWLLLKTNIDVIDADADGNSALHWILRLLRLLCPQQIKILSLLLEHGARVSQRTACHIAAGNGNSVALEVLLLQDPDGVQYKTEMKETPLFFAVKNESMDCAELFLTWGANSEIFNLCGQGAIDLATSQDMCYILLNPTTVSLIKHAFPSQDKCTALELTDEDTTTERYVISSTKAEICKYLDSHRGCVGGAKCFYAHCEEESWKVKEGADWSHYPAAKQLKRKIFVGELPSSVDSDVLGKFFEEEFGSVEDAIVIVTQTENKVQSRGFGFVTFREEKSVSAAVRADYVTLRGKQIEIKILNPNLFFASEFEKMSPQQREQEKNFQYQLPLQKSNKKIMKGDNSKQRSWADRLLLRQPKACSIEPQAHITKSSEDPSTPIWLKVFKKWFLGFLQSLPKHPKYALSSLKADFRAKFGLELDHSSLGYSKLSDFLKCFSDLCTIECLPICKCEPPTHMILQPKFPRPQRRLLHTHKTPDTQSFFALIENSGDLKCLPDLSIGDGDESKCIQDLSADDGGDSKCVQNLSVDGSSDTNCLHNLSADNAVDSKYHQDISIFNASENYNLNATSYVEEKPSCVYQEKKNCAENKSHCVHSGQLHGQKEIDMLAGETDNGSIEDNNMSKSYFIRESDFCTVEVIGTTNIACPLPEGIMIAFDSRATVSGKIASDMVEKFALITPSVLATMCGNVYEVKQTWNHMKRFISNETAEGSDPMHVYSAGNIGLRMGRSADAKSFEFFIAGLQSGTPTCYHLVYENEKNKKLDKIEMCKVVGSGSSFADIVFSPNWKGYGNNVSLEEAIQRACWALLIAALWDKHTGGILTVIYVGPNGIVIKSCKTVLALYIEFYNVSLRLVGDGVNEDGSNVINHTLPFSALEGVSVFLFYIPCNVDQASLLKRLRSKNRIIRLFGHPLTELADGYYMHRVLFERNRDSQHFLKETVNISNKMVLPFSKSRDFRYVRVRKQTIFVASQSMEMLQSLEVSKALKNIFVLPTREQCVEERVNIRNTIIQEEIDKLQNLQLDEEQFQLQKRKWRRICFCERETEEQTERERSQKQWFLEQEKIQNEPLQITYSYWDGAGHRQTIQVRKGDKIGEFLRSVQQQLAPEFQEVRTTSVENLLYVKEDLIIPHQHSFYELIINKARGKSGPLFHFDVHQDVRTIADATIEKDESHPGKVVERHWYEKNKHIFPASRWEIYDPTSVTPSTETD